MIRLENLHKTYRLHGTASVVASGITCTFPKGVSVALLGRNGAGKSSLLRMIGGEMDPDRGRVLREGSVSWPVGFGGSFNANMTGAQNVRFVARIYGIDTDDLADYVAEFSELGPHFHLPLKSYSSGMRARLSFGVSMGIPFDTYLVDEVTAVGDATFKRKCEEVFGARLAASGAVIVSHSLGFVRRTCQAGAVLERGHLTYFDDVECAIAAHLANLEAAGPG